MERHTLRLFCIACAAGLLAAACGKSATKTAIVVAVDHEEGIKAECVRVIVTTQDGEERATAPIPS